MSDVVVAFKPLTAITYTFYPFMGDIRAALYFFIRMIIFEITESFFQMLL